MRQHGFWQRLLWPLSGLALAGCQPSGQASVELADMHLGAQRPHPIHQSSPEVSRRAHALGVGWGRPEESGRWVRGETAEIHFDVLGHGVELEIVWSTSTEISQLGQTVELRWNSTPLGSFPVDRGWKQQKVNVRLDDAVLHPGRNTLTLAPELHARPSETDQRELSVFVRELRLSAVLTTAEQSEWEQRSRAAPLDDAWVETHPLPQTPPPSDAPDVLLVILDTARADRFGAYGYHRDTTPFADQLAARGVRLDQVFAEAPYTRASVHGVLTGHSWHQHRILDEGDRLGERWITLPEVLRGAGYRTLGFLDNAQVSEASGATQGFDEWVEAWKDERVKGWAPAHVVTLVEERLAKGVSDQPTFLFAHILPPHNPYLPGHEHDRWRDPDYTGPISGRNADIFRFDREQHPASGEDYDRLVALYDGNLHLGDALAERVVEAWRALERERELVVVLLSDHGEAFGEHGRYSHNSTVHDEMMHVPAILYPRDRFRAVVGSESRFRSLTDVTPILLHALAIHPAAGDWPTRFTQVLHDPTLPRDEIFMRAASGVVGIRTPEALAFYKPGEARAYFDLRQDPQAMHNLAWSQSDEYYRLTGRLQAFVESSEHSAESAPLSPEDEERLRALGYL